MGKVLLGTTDGIESAIKKAKAAAGDKNVTVIGGATGCAPGTALHRVPL